MFKVYKLCLCFKVSLFKNVTRSPLANMFTARLHRSTLSRIDYRPLFDSHLRLARQAVSCSSHRHNLRTQLACLTTTAHPSDARALIKAAGPTLPGPDEEMTADGEQLDPASSRALRRSLWRQVVFALLFTSGAFVTAAYYERQRRLGYLPIFSFFLFILNSFYLLFLSFFFVCS
jgi:hypothetical protein